MLAFAVNLRSCNTLQAALDLVQKQRPFEGKALGPDEVSLSTTIPSLGSTIFGQLLNFKHLSTLHLDPESYNFAKAICVIPVNVILI